MNAWLLMIGLAVNDPDAALGATLETEAECTPIATAINHVALQVPGEDGKRMHAWCAEIKYLTLEAPLNATELP